MLHSLQARLAVALAVGLAALSLLVGAAAFHVLQDEIDRISDSALQETAQRLVPLAVTDILDLNTQGSTGQRVAAVRAHDELLTYIVRDQTGKTVLQSHDADPGVFPADLKAGFTSTASHRIYTETVLQGTVLLAVAEPLVERRHVSTRAALAVIEPLLVLILFGLVGTWLIVKTGLRPISLFCEGVASRGRDDLTPLAKAGMPTEIEPIADAVNDLMQRLDRALSAERSFTANSAHELRTPIAAALAQTQRLVAEAQGTPIEQRARNVEITLQTLVRLSEKLMQLARAEGAHVLSDIVQDLRPVLQLVVDDVRRIARSNQLTLTQPDEPVLSRIDQDAFAILARNLIENAVKHGTDATAVRITLTSGGTLSVRNRGPIVPSETLARLSQPFERGTTTAKGSGLGLAIVNAIAQAAGARLTLGSPAAGMPDGFEAAVEGLAIPDSPPVFRERVR